VPRYRAIPSPSQYEEVIFFHSEVARQSTKTKGSKQEAQVAKKKHGGGGVGGQQDYVKKSRKLET
jgi:hypothetical protein